MESAIVDPTNTDAYNNHHSSPSDGNGQSYSSRSSSSSCYYYAIRNSRTVHNCIFLNWQDAQDHVVPSDCEWQSFESLHAAEDYLRRHRRGPPAGTTTTTTAAVPDEPPLRAGNTVANPRDENAPPFSPVPTATATTTTTTTKPSTVPPPPQESTTRKTRDTNEPPKTNNKKRHRNDSSISEQKQQQQQQQRKPHAKWLEMLVRLQLYHQQHDTFDVRVPRKPRGIERAQEETGDAKSKAALRLWLQEQDQQFANRQQGRKSSMTLEKIRLLKEIGYDLNNNNNNNQSAFDDYLAQLQRYIVENPNRPIPPLHPLYKWVQQMRVQVQRLENGKNSSLLTGKQALQLKNTGYFAKSPPIQDDDPDWDAMYERLKEYKKTHGDCLVNTTNWRDPLVKWVLAQRRHYLTVEEGGSSNLLTTKKLMKLHAIGFVFRQKEKYRTFEERVEELKEYKAQHGNLRVPTNTPGLGAFVAHARDQYRLSKLGRKHTMNDQKFQTLHDIGFEFKVGKTPTVTTYPRLNWEERFQQLLQYKEEYGDTIVPQHFSGYNNLGAWVKTQRGNYKLMKKGGRSPMTTEMALKLSEIGFVWEVSNGGSLKRKFRSSKGEKSGEVYSSSDSESEDEPVSKASVGMLALGSSPSKRPIGNSQAESRRYYDFI